MAVAKDTLQDRHDHKHPSRFFLSLALELDMYGNKDGSIPASYRILYFIGWKPDPSQVSHDATLLSA